MSSQTGQSPDVLIVGGGAIGCAIAHYLAKDGACVTVVDRQPIAREASWAAAGVIGPSYTLTSSPARVALERRSLTLYPALIAELHDLTGLSVDYQRAGQLTVALDIERETVLRETLAWQRAHGFDVAWLDADEIRQREPILDPPEGLAGAIWCPDALTVRAHRLTVALARAAQLRGATIVEDAPVLDLLAAGDRVTGVRTPQGDLHAGQVVIAAGAWTGQLGALLDLALPIRPVHGQMLALAPASAAPPLRAIIAGGGGFLAPRADGTVAVAATVDEHGFTTRVTPDGLSWLAGLVQTLTPSLADARVVATWAGLRPASADGEPLLGRVPGYANLWVATGHFRNGILWAPVTGEIIAASLRAGQPDPALAPFDPARFVTAGAGPASPTNTL